MWSMSVEEMTMTCDEFRKFLERPSQQDEKGVSPISADLPPMIEHIKDCRECRMYMIEKVDVDKLLHMVFGI